MADRTVSYTFRGNFASLAAGLTAMSKGVTDVGVKLTALDKTGAKSRRGLTTLGSTAGKFGLVAAAGFGAAVLAAANFDQAMSSVQAATHETAANMELLRAAALKAGADTKFSATEAAAGIEALAKAGVATSDILAGGLTGALDLAAAGNLEVGQAAEIAATAMTQFNLAGSDVPHVADLLAAGAGKAQGEVTDLAQALNQSGLVAAQMGLSIEETTGTLSAFASAGLLGSDAGTSLKTMLLRLANPSQKASEEMESLGINAYDANGNLVTMSALADQLQGAFQGQTQATRDAALATIFGSDAIRAANVLYSQGSAGITDWKNKVDDSGFAAETAAIKMDNLKGDLEQLKGSLETALIGGGSGAQGPFRGFVQGATDAVNVFNKLPSSVQSTTTNMLALTAVTGGAAWFGSKVIGGVASAKQALQDLGLSATQTKGLLSNVGTGLKVGGILASLALVSAALDELDKGVNEADLSRNLEALAGGRTSDDLKQVGGDIESVNKALNAIGEPLEESASLFGLLGDTNLDKAQSDIEKIDQALAGLVESGRADIAAQAFAEFQRQANELGVSTADVTKTFDAYATAQANAGHQGNVLGGFIKTVSAAEKGLTASTDRSASAIDNETASLEDNIKAMREKRAAALSAFDAETQWREALKSATAQAKRNEAGIRGNSHAALENRSQLSQLAGAWNNQSAAVKNNNARFREARSAFINTAVAMGVPREQARLLAKQLLEIPKSREVKVTADTAGARTELQQINAIRLDDKVIHVRTSRDFGSGPGFAGGGYTGDRPRHAIAGVVHGREFVVDADKTAKHRPLLEAIQGGAPGYEQGGFVADRRYSDWAGSGGGGGSIHVSFDDIRVGGKLTGEGFMAQVEGIARAAARSEINGEARHQKRQDRT